ncbi:hypothetical protein SAMN04488550_4589 [Gordonia malaquae]|uniref:Uncharacterized protein n=1 Tax=Gordonia malaquae NBRC 108250 TaxID=1223542 RepID=M3UP03_GORML|nr:hypothetical protein [Gordonia malaquae]GAC81975.1 hypothetical protein GM1_055_00060 [Gordonia malaquae NBRC 108250]SEE57855.1 hypothetical protein SAMN04488550_4578 [Gordonia malaquae]SEE58163.1 hypothetical protein SAMN04488550_4589 [Gordonia malaquae]
MLLQTGLAARKPKQADDGSIWFEMDNGQQRVAAVERAAADLIGAPPESAAAFAARIARRGVVKANPAETPVKKRPVEPSRQDCARRAVQKPQDPRRGLGR